MRLHPTWCKFLFSLHAMNGLKSKASFNISLIEIICHRLSIKVLIFRNTFLKVTTSGKFS